MKGRPGFTLVELATAITVIAILATIAVLSYQSTQISARNQIRESTANLILSHLERYYEENGEYPYGNDLNPTISHGKLNNYNAVIALMPGLDESVLDSGGYNFFSHACASSACSYTPADVENRPTQYNYFNSARPGAVGIYLRHSLWGCSIEIPDDTSSPGAVLFWKEEASGKWIFKRTKHGDVTIKNHNAGPQPPTVCEFSN